MWKHVCSNPLQLIEVNKKIKPVHPRERKIPKLVQGGHYYVSFGDQVAAPCVLEALSTEADKTFIQIAIPCSVQSSKGRMISDGKSRHNLFADEIGLTPEDAVRNGVTM